MTALRYKLTGITHERALNILEYIIHDGFKKESFWARAGKCDGNSKVTSYTIGSAAGVIARMDDAVIALGEADDQPCLELTMKDDRNKEHVTARLEAFLKAMNVETKRTELPAPKVRNSLRELQ
jgi:hypothetical protein